MLGIPCIYSRKGPSINFLGPGKQLFSGGSPTGYIRPEKFMFMLFFFLSDRILIFWREIWWEFRGNDFDPENKGSKLWRKFRSIFRKKICCSNKNLSSKLHSADVPP